jgi:hypothetical protein
MKQKDDPIGQWRSKNAIEQLTAEEANRIAQQVAAKEAQRTPEDLMTERADKVTSDCIQTFLRMRNLKVTPTSFAEGVQMLYDLHKAEFNKWSKDELVVFASFQNSIIACEQLRLRTDLI